MASSQLQERALDWYDLLLAEIVEAELSWKQFKSHFELKCMTWAGKAALARRFIDLKQGSSSVFEYVATFVSLSKYGLELIRTPLHKNQKFVDMLRKHLRKTLLTQLEVSFEKLVDTTLKLKEIQNDRQKPSI